MLVTSEQAQVIAWFASVIALGLGVLFAYRILRALGYFPPDGSHRTAFTLLWLAGAAIIALPIEQITFRVLNLILLLTSPEGKNLPYPSVWGSIPYWVYGLLDMGLYLAVLAGVVWLGWGRLPELLAWGKEEEEAEEAGEVDEAEDEPSGMTEGDADTWEDDWEADTGGEEVTLSFLDQALLMLGIAQLIYGMLNRVTLLMLSPAFLSRPRRPEPNAVGFGSVWVASLILFAMVGYLMYNKAGEG